MNQQWVNEELDYQAFYRQIEDEFGHALPNLIHCILQSDINRLVAFATYFVKIELRITYENEFGRENPPQSFANYANLGLIDAWITRARQLTELQQDT